MKQTTPTPEIDAVLELAEKIFVEYATKPTELTASEVAAACINAAVAFRAESRKFRAA